MSLYMSVTSANELAHHAASGSKIFAEKTYFRLLGASFSGHRKISMVMGAQSANDGGVAHLSEVVVRKKMDAASGMMLSFFYAPGVDGQEIKITSAVPDRGGAGEIAAHDIVLTGARLSSFAYDTDADGVMNEVFTITYNTIEQQFYYENEHGELVKGGTVGMSVATSECTSLETYC